MKNLIILFVITISNFAFGQPDPCERANYEYEQANKQFDTLKYSIENRELIWNSIKTILDYELGAFCKRIEGDEIIAKPFELDLGGHNIFKYSSFFDFLELLIKDEDFIEKYALTDNYFKQTLLYYKGRIYQAIRFYHQSKGVYQSILNHEFPEGFSEDKIRAKVLYRMAQISFAENNYEKAIEYCNDIRNLKTRPNLGIMEKGFDNDMEAGVYAQYDFKNRKYVVNKISIAQDRLMLYILKHQNKDEEIIGFLKLRAKEELFYKHNHLIGERKKWYPNPSVFQIIPKGHRYSYIYKKIRTENIYLDELVDYFQTKNKIKEMKKLNKMIGNVRNENNFNKLIAELEK